MSTGWWDYVESLLAREHWRPSDLAERTGIDASVISRWKNDGAQPRIDALRAISHAANVPMLHLLVAAGHLEPEEAALQDVDITPRADVSDVLSAIEHDPDLLPEAKRHLTSQYGLLLRVSPGPVSGPADRTKPRADDESALPLRAVARKRTTRGRSKDSGGGST